MNLFAFIVSTRNWNCVKEVNLSYWQFLHKPFVSIYGLSTHWLDLLRSNFTHEIHLICQIILMERNSMKVLLFHQLSFIVCLTNILKNN